MLQTSITIGKSKKKKKGYLSFLVNNYVTGQPYDLFSYVKGILVRLTSNIIFHFSAIGNKNKSKGRTENETKEK